MRSLLLRKICAYGIPPTKGMLSRRSLPSSEPRGPELFGFLCKHRCYLGETEVIEDTRSIDRGWKASRRERARNGLLEWFCYSCVLVARAAISLVNFCRNSSALMSSVFS